jgi:sugar phosphate permease
MNKYGFIGGFGPLVGVTAASPPLGWVDTDSDWLFLYWGIWSAAFKERLVMSGG